MCLNLSVVEKRRYWETEPVANEDNGELRRSSRKRRKLHEF